MSVWPSKRYLAHSKLGKTGAQRLTAGVRCESDQKNTWSIHVLAVFFTLFGVWLPHNHKTVSDPENTTNHDNSSSKLAPPPQEHELLNKIDKLFLSLNNRTHEPPTVV